MNNIIVIRNLLSEEIAWVKETGHPRWLGYFDGDKCELRLGDFPAESLYTLLWRGESFDFDDSPPCWTIPRD